MSRWGGVKSGDRRWNADEAKAALLLVGSTDADWLRQHGERTGLDTPLVLAVNDECQPSLSLGLEHAWNTPPGKYGQTETQRN